MIPEILFLIEEKTSIAKINKILALLYTNKLIIKVNIVVKDISLNRYVKKMRKKRKNITYDINDNSILFSGETIDLYIGALLVFDLYLKQNMRTKEKIKNINTSEQLINVMIYSLKYVNITNKQLMRFFPFYKSLIMITDQKNVISLICFCLENTIRVTTIGLLCRLNYYSSFSSMETFFSYFKNIITYFDNHEIDINPLVFDMYCYFSFFQKLLIKHSPEDILNYLHAAQKILIYTKQYPNPELINLCNNDNIRNKIEKYSYFFVNYRNISSRTIQYSFLRKRIDYIYPQIARNLHYNDFINEKFLYNQNNKIVQNLLEASLWTALEALRLENFIKQLIKYSDRSIFVISNLSLGFIYSYLIEKSLTNSNNLIFLNAKINSEYYHQNEYLTIDPFFSKLVWKDIAEKNPHIVVFDSSINYRFPDSFKGYINVFSAFNEAMGYTKHLLCRKEFTENMNKEIQINKNVATYKTIKQYFIDNLYMNGLVSQEYKLKVLGHPMINRLSRKRYGKPGSLRTYYNNINDSDIVEDNQYNENLVSKQYFANNLSKKQPYLFLLSAFIPFIDIYGDRINDSFEYETGMKCNFYHKENRAYSFDDKDFALVRGIIKDSNGEYKLNNTEIVDYIYMKYEQIKYNRSRFKDDK